MRSTLPVLAAGLLLASTGVIAAAPSTTGPMKAGAPSTSTDTGTTSTDTSNASGASSSASPAASAGANASATAGGFKVGEPVKDNTGATIGEISALTPGANGSTMAVIKMGTDTFQVATDRLGSADGSATINLSQAQIATMVHGKAGGAASGGAATSGSSASPP